MKATGDIGMKITAAQREFFRYSGISAELERRGFGSSRVDLSWAVRHPLQKSAHEPRIHPGKSG